MDRHLVRDVMTPTVVVVTSDCGYKRIVDVLADFAVSAVPVVDSDDRVIGVVSEADLMYKAESHGGVVPTRPFDRRGRRAARRKASGETARELMTTPAITVSPSAPIWEAARLMERHGVKRLPVVDDSTGAMVGIIARRDVLRRYLRDDASIREDVVEDVLRRTMWIDPLGIDVIVEEGRVRLTGRTDRRSTAQIAVELVRDIEGVVGVVDELTWDHDDTVNTRRHMLLDAAV